MVQTVARRYTFEAAHQLMWHRGRCRNLHGHSYVLEVCVRGALDERGVVLDFAELDEVVRRQIVEVLDHSYLNDRFENPTAELIACWVGDQLQASGLAWSAVRLWETEDGSVIVEP